MSTWQVPSNEYLQHTFLWRNKKNITWIPPLIRSYVCDLAKLGTGCDETVFKGFG